MLTIIRATLQPGGESLRIIAQCVHAGGMIQVAGVNHDQALKLLDTRWNAADTPEFDLGSEARALHNMTWPRNLGVDEFNDHFNRALTAAGRIKQNPSTDNADDITTRSTWWHVIAEPPRDSPYFEAAAAARAVTQQQCTTVAHRNAWRAAFIKEIDTLVKAGVGKTAGGRAVAGRSASAFAFQGGHEDEERQIAPGVATGQTLKGPTWALRRVGARQQPCQPW